MNTNWGTSGAMVAQLYPPSNQLIYSPVSWGHGGPILLIPNWLVSWWHRGPSPVTTSQSGKEPSQPFAASLSNHPLWQGGGTGGIPAQLISGQLHREVGKGQLGSFRDWCTGIGDKPLCHQGRQYTEVVYDSTISFLGWGGEQVCASYSRPDILALLGCTVSELSVSVSATRYLTVIIAGKKSFLHKKELRYNACVSLDYSWIDILRLLMAKILVLKCKEIAGVNG